MEKNADAETSRRARTRGLVLNPVQVGLSMGFIAIGLLVVFGLGVIIGMWYQANEHITPDADTAGERLAQERATEDVEPEVTFYSTLVNTSEAAPAPLPASPSKPGVSAVQKTPIKLPVHSTALPVSRVSERLSQPAAPHYSVQVGSFRAAEQAEKLQKRLIQKGYDARVRLFMVPGQGAWYRVRVGRFSERTAAEKVARRLHTQEQIPVMVAMESR